MRKVTTLLLVFCLILSISPISATESVIILDDPELKYLSSAFYNLEGTAPLESIVKVNGKDAEMFRRFESTVPLNPAPSYTRIKIEVLDENKNLIESQALQIENYRKTEIIFYTNGLTMTVNGCTTAIDVLPQKVGIHMYVPFKYICEGFFGKSSTWDEESQIETFSGGGYDVSIPLDSEYFYVNGEKKKFFQHEPIRAGGETLVPKWLPEEAFDCKNPGGRYSNTIIFEKEFHPEKDFEEMIPNPESAIEFVKLQKSVIDKQTIDLKGNIPNEYSVKLNGETAEIYQKFRKTINIIEKPADNPVFIEVFDENDEFVESKNIDLSDDEVLMMTWIDKPNMLINGKVKAYGVSPYIINGSSIVPIEAIIEAFDLESSYLGESKTYVIRNGQVKIELPQDECFFIVNGIIAATSAPSVVIIDNQATVPLRAIVEALGLCVEWIAAEKIVKVTK